ncbi:MAG: hypothetical protein IV090_03020 [Candidatus Sericytochromatia bacterium]|nr:hypothetical protein [Candidatus Sericytochromatia bacterium]
MFFACLGGVFQTCAQGAYAQEPSAQDICLNGNLSVEPRIKACSTALVKTPENSQLYFTRAQLYMFIENPTQALSDINAVLALEPNNSEAYELFVKIKFRSSTFSKVLSMRKKYYQEHNNYSKAIEDLNLIIELQPKIYLNYYNRAQMWLKLKAFDKALGDFDTIQTMMPNELPNEPWVLIDWAEIWLYKKICRINSGI